MDLTPVGDPAVWAELGRRVDAKRPAPVVRPPLPEPEVRARPAAPEEIRGGAKALAPSADAVHYARGPYIGADGGVLGRSESLVLRWRLGAVAAWERRLPDGKWSFAGAWHRDADGWHRLSSAELKAWVADPYPHRHQCAGEPCVRAPYDRTEHYVYLGWCGACRVRAEECATRVRQKREPRTARSSRFRVRRFLL